MNIEKELVELRKKVWEIAEDVAFMKGRLKNGRNKNMAYLGTGGVGLGAILMKLIEVFGK